MPVFSCLRNVSKITCLTKRVPQILLQSHRVMSEHNTFTVTASRWQWHKFKDYFHLYVMVGAIPIGLLITYVNVYIGPATLAPIPEGYVPKHYEYYRHPITRFLARYCHVSPQENYEKLLHFAWEEMERAELRRLEREILKKMGERGDYQGYYFIPYKNPAKARRMAIEREELREMATLGDKFTDA